MYAGNSVINNSGLQNKNNGKPKKIKTKQFMKFALKRTYEFLSRFDFLFSRQEQQQQQYKEQQQQFLLTHLSCVRCQNNGTWSVELALPAWRCRW